jgi:hypothetical protein
LQGDNAGYQANFSYNGTAVTIAPNVVGTMAAGVLNTAAKWYIGGRQSVAAQRGPLNMYDVVVYEAQPSVSALAAALA